MSNESMHEETYSVAANPVYHINHPLYVLFAGESQTKPQHAVGPKIYDYYLLHYIEQGKGVFRSEQHVYELGAGSCFLIHPGKLVSYASDSYDPWRYRWIAFSGSQAQLTAEESGLGSNQPVLTNIHKDIIPTAMASIRDAFFTKKESSDMASLGIYILFFLKREISCQVRSGQQVPNRKYCGQSRRLYTICLLSMLIRYPSSICARV